MNTTTMTTFGDIKVLGALAALALAGGCATGSQHHAAGPRTESGRVSQQTATPLVLAEGPALLHVTAEFPIGKVVLMDATANGCDAAGAATGPATAVRTDRRIEVRVAAGQLACLVSNFPGKYPIAWHTHDLNGERSELVASNGR